MKGLDFEILEQPSGTTTRESKRVFFQDYEDIDFEAAISDRTNVLICAYAIRKALIRKHYLSNTIDSWTTKHPDSLLKRHFKPSIHFELDYAEFLDDALVDAWDLHESMSRNDTVDHEVSREWWILKPGMSDGGNGIRLFSSIEDLQSIFEEWDPPSDDEEGDDDDNRTQQQASGSADFAGSVVARNRTDQDQLMTSQLRHFVVQPYLADPLLLSKYQNRKFHIRVYVVAVGALKVFVYRNMLALFAARSYQKPGSDGIGSEVDLGSHLTNTCFQDEATKDTAVYLFNDLDDPSLTLKDKSKVFEQICEVMGETFEAAAREQMVHFQVIPNAYEVFGVDFLVDENMNVWLLELNAYPDFKQTGDVLQDKVVGGLFTGVVKSVVAPFFGVTEHTTSEDQLVLVKDINLGRG